MVTTTKYIRNVKYTHSQGRVLYIPPSLPVSLSYRPLARIWPYGIKILLLILLNNMVLDRHQVRQDPAHEQLRSRRRQPVHMQRGRHGGSDGTYNEGQEE